MGLVRSGCTQPLVGAQRQGATERDEAEPAFPSGPEEGGGLEIEYEASGS